MPAELEGAAPVPLEMLAGRLAVAGSLLNVGLGLENEICPAGSSVTIGSLGVETGGLAIGIGLAACGAGVIGLGVAVD